MCEWLANGTESGAPALRLLAEMHAAATDNLRERLRAAFRQPAIGGGFSDP
jgi:hypothetical protein